MLRFLLCFSALFLAPVAATASVASPVAAFPGVTALGASAQQTVTVTLPLGGAIDSVHVLTQGSESQDFAAVTGGTCIPGLTLLPLQSCTVNIAFTPRFPGQRRGAVVLLARGNAVLATQLLAASATGAVGVFVPGTIQSVAGNTAWIYAGDGGLATQSPIFLPFGFAVDAAGDIFIADSSNNRIRRVDAVTGIITTFAGNGIIGATGDGGLATAASISNPSSIALDPAGNLFFTDTGNNAVRRVDAFTGVITTVAGILGSAGYTGDSGLALAATLNTPNGLTFDAAGDLFIADTGNNVVRRVDASTTIISTIAGRGVASSGGDGGPANSAGLNTPWSVTLDASANLFIADQNNNRIRRVDASTGIISTVAGTGSVGFSGDGGLAALAQLNVPASVAFDIAGNLYIADSGNNRVRKVNVSTGIITTFAGSGALSISGDDGPATSAGIYGPYTLAFDSQGSLFIADVFHNRIRKVSSSAAALQYPAMRVNRVSSPLSQGFENDGNAALDIQSLLAVSNSQLDPLATTCGLATPLAPGGSCNLSLAFAPTVIGDSVTGTFNVVSNAGNSPSVVTLSGKVLSVDPTTLVLTSSANPVQTGNQVTFTATATSQGVTPTGTITLLDGTLAIGTIPLSNGIALFSTSSLTAGQHYLTASYSGDTNNTAATSDVLIQLVQDPQAATTTTLISSASQLVAGAPLQLAAGITGTTPGAGSGPIAGTVTFLDGSTPLGTATVTNGSAALTVSTLAAGTHTITASYNGSSTYLHSTSAPVSELVTIAASHVALTSAANPSTAGAALTLTATLTSNGGTPTGLVTFTDGATTLGTATANAQGIATLHVPGVSWTVGLHTLTAVFAGNTSYSTATSTSLAESITVSPTTITLASSANPVAQSATLTLTAAVAAASATAPAPTGTVTFLDGSATLGSAALDASGHASLTLSTLALGNHALTAVYAGDTFSAPSTSAGLAQSVIGATTSVALTSSANPAAFAAPLTLSAVVTGSGAHPTGAVTFLDSSATLGSATLDASGHAAITLSTLTAGPHTLTASYAGDAIHAATVSAPLTQSILQATTTVLAASAASVLGGTPLTLTAAVTGTAAKVPTGSLTFADGATILGSAPLDATGHATLTTSTLLTGSHVLTATYAGDTLSAPSTSASVAVVVTQQPSITLTSSANPSLVLDSITLTATVAGSGAHPPTGTVTLLEGSTVLGTSGFLPNLTVQFTIASPSAGQHQYVVKYSGDTLNAPVTSPVFTQVVNLRPTGTQLTLSSSTLTAGSQIIFVAVVQGSGPNPLTGSVTFQSGSTIFGSAPLNSFGIAMLTTVPAQGTFNAVAQYSGDSLYAPSTSTASALTVGPTVEFTITPASSTLSMASGSHAMLQFTVVTASTLSDTLNFGCSGLPTYATCTFTSNSVSVSNGVTKSLSVLIDTGNPLGAGATASLESTTTAPLACLLPAGAILAALLFRSRRRKPLICKHLALFSALLLTFTFTILLTGCGNNFSQSKTAPGTYNIQIVGTGVSTGAIHSANVTLQVTQ